jgi:hypothetical protein
MIGLFSILMQHPISVRDETLDALADAQVSHYVPLRMMKMNGLLWIRCCTKNVRYLSTIKASHDKIQL